MGKVIGGILLAVFGGIPLIPAVIMLLTDHALLGLAIPEVLFFVAMLVGGVFLARAGLREIKERATPLQMQPVAGAGPQPAPGTPSVAAPLSAARPTPMGGDEICRNCGWVGRPKKRVKGSFGLELVLWLCFIIPGLIYSVWRGSTRAKTCAKCGATDMLPLDTPLGAEIYNRFYASR